MSRIYFVSFLILVTGNVYSQMTTNADPSQSYINVNTPRTPESAGFEKYGTTQVSEFTGTTNIAIPLYTLKSRFLQAPITLSYQATGIKVNQEASWVGLGWDLNVGGRITVEIRGCADFNGLTRGLSAPASLSTGMQRIFNRLGHARENAVMTPSTLCENPGDPGCTTDTNFDYLPALQEMTEFGTGEPDIFRANFMGRSLTYYVDKISNSIKFIGEQSLFNISYTLDGFNNITAWTIVDDDGVTYYFNQPETSTNTLPGNAVIPATTTSAWLLTKAVHPSGDYIQYTYNSYGLTVPAFTMSGWVNWLFNSSTLTTSNDVNQNVTMQSPYYLTRVESADAAVDFTLDTRTDLYGPGSRKLTQIKISDKFTGIVKKTATFNYSYFQSNFNPWASYLSSLNYYLPPPLSAGDYLACSSSRLRLDSVSVELSTYQPPYKFSYNSGVPDKYSYSQDHWGYYNGVSNYTNGYSFSHLIPFSGIGGVQNLTPANVPLSSYIGFNRDCDGDWMQAMILTGIVYPTGGSTSFTYEPHQSSTALTVFVTGGGVRVKTVSNYESGKMTGITNYTYSGGKYMGVIKYFTNANELAGCNSGGNNPQLKYSTTGAINFNDILIGYAQITIQEQGPTGLTNGYLVKTFNINTPSSNYANGGLGFDLAPPYIPPLEIYPSLNGFTYDQMLDPANKAFPPTPSANLEGKLMQEQYFDNSNNPLKSVNYYYHLANYTHDLYDIKAIQNRTGGFDLSCGGDNNEGFSTGGNRPVYLFVSPAKSFHALQDSVVEMTYSGSNFTTKTKAYHYNAYFQPEYEIDYNSDGTQTVTHTQTSLAINPLHPLQPEGDQSVRNLQTAHIYDLPIEQTVIHRGLAGDSMVVSSRLNIYQGSLLQRVYNMEAPQPLVLESQFTPLYYYYPGYPGNPTDDWDSLRMDSHYVLYTSADYSPNNQIWTLHTLKGNMAYIWDEGYNTLLAQCSNADSANVAFTSFETAATGRWSYDPSGVVTDNTAPAGNNAYGLSTGNISLGGLSSSTSYIVSYWSKTGSFTVSGSSAIRQGKTINGWTYFEHSVSGTSTVTISGGGSIDEVRLYPSSSQMTTYTYAPLIGITSQSDANNRINYYFYDAINRLKWIKDQDGNIIKTFQYHFQSIPGAQY